MKTTASRKRSDGIEAALVLIRKGIVRLVLGLLSLGAILFGTSGSLSWTMGWVFLGVLLACIGINLTVLMSVNPEVVAVRIQGKGLPRKWDAGVVSAIGVFWLVALIVAGLDQRFRWSPSMALWTQIASVAPWVLGDLLCLWAMSVNRFFYQWVRIQTERDHSVVAAGPYQAVRHPGYVGWLLISIATPLILGSLWALVPAGVAIGLMIVRTLLEDSTLQEELEGYRDYARQVRYRLIPGVW